MNISIKVIYAVWQEFELLDCQIHIDVWYIEWNFSFAPLMFEMKKELISIDVNTNVRQCFCIDLLQNWWLGWSCWIFCGELVYICRSLGLEFGFWDTCPKMQFLCNHISLLWGNSFPNPLHHLDSYLSGKCLFEHDDLT
jgi:hypothetical protein